MSICFDSDGNYGAVAIDGVDGVSGIDFATERDGAPGTDAGLAEPGEAGGDMKIHLVTAKRADGVLIARISADAKSSQSDRKIHSKRDQYVLPLTEIREIEWSARGGNGGNGGRGGNGGNGGRGTRGSDATEREPGSDGEAGGEGGDGGCGSDGKPGGNGGSVELVMKMRDTFLLMKVAGCDPLIGVGDRLAGGKGGASGVHGNGGQGGLGGDGGSLYKYIVKNVATHNSDSGVIQTIDCQYVTMNGGKQGPRGLHGATPKTPLVAGENGESGTLSIRVLSDDNSETRVYSQRYSLVLASIEEKKLSTLKTSDGIPTLEFGETVIVPFVKVTNIGKMPSPPERVEIALSRESENIVINNNNRLFLRTKACIMPSKTAEANQGFLRFQTMKPRTEMLGDDYGPLQKLAVRRFKAFQLGPEVMSGNQLVPLSNFSAEYPSFDLPNGTTVRLAYPVENRLGIDGLKVLAAGEATSVRLSLLNTSTTSLGSKSESQRALQLQYYLSEEDSDNSVGLQGIKFIRGPLDSSDKRRKVLCIDPKRVDENGFKGHSVKIKSLPAGVERVLVHTLMFSTKAKAFSHATLQVDILLEELPELLPDMGVKKTGNMLLVQRRKLVVSCQPTFRNDSSTEAVLVTSLATTSEQYHTWITMLEGLLGLKTETYSLCVHGHLDPNKDVVYKAESGQRVAKLRDILAGRVVVVLNDMFPPLPNESSHFKCRPSLLMARLQDYHPSTHWLLVGSDSASIQHLSSLGSCIFMKGGPLDRPVLADGTERTSDVTETEISGKDVFEPIPTSYPSNVLSEQKACPHLSEKTASSTEDHIVEPPTVSKESLPALADLPKEVTPDSDNPEISVAVAGPTGTSSLEQPQEHAAPKPKKDIVQRQPQSKSQSADHSVPITELHGAETCVSVTELTESEASATTEIVGTEPGARKGVSFSTSLNKAEWVSKHAVQHENIKSFKAWLLQALNEERKSGQNADIGPVLNVASVKGKLVFSPTTSQRTSVIAKHAASLRQWLSKQDPVRLYVIEMFPAPRPFKVKDGLFSVWNFGSLIIHRGVSRNDNSLVEVRAAENGASLQSIHMIQNTVVLYSVAATMDTMHKIRCYCHALRGSGPDNELSFAAVREVLRDSLVSDFLFEVSYLFDAKIELDANTSFDICTVTLQSLASSETLRELMHESETNHDLRAVLESQLSDLMARFEVVVDPRSIVNHWLPPLARKKHPLCQRLLQSVSTLKDEWGDAYMNEDIIQERRRQVEQSVVSLLKEDPSRDWRDALYFLHSPGDRHRYTAPSEVHVRRHSEIEIHDRGNSSSLTTCLKIQKCIPFTVETNEVSKFEADYFERQKFGERVRNRVQELRSAYLLR